MPRLAFDFQLPVSSPHLAKNRSAAALNSRQSFIVTSGRSLSQATLCCSCPLYLIIVEIQNWLVHVSAVQCPKCSHYQDFSSLGACETCGRSDWVASGAFSGGTIIACPHCERGPSEVPCEKCGATILGNWLVREPPSLPLSTPTEPITWDGIAIIAVIIILVIIALVTNCGIIT